LSARFQSCNVAMFQRASGFVFEPFETLKH
jgi:hypothetical protein